jgi:HlyD family secretion protein
VARAQAAAEQTQANLKKALASVAKAKANYANAKNINDRRQRLLQSQNASVEQADISKAAEEATLADVDLAESEVAVARAAISDTKAQGQQEAATLDFHTLISPYDAMVVVRQKELGSALAAGEQVFTLIDPQQVWVLAYIDESKAGEVEIGEPADIILRSRPGQRFKGRIARIEVESDRVNEERRVAVAFDQLPDNFHLGEQAEVYITTLQLAQAVLVPEEAIVGLRRNQGTVWTVEDGHLQQREVAFGHRLLDGRYEITGGAPDEATVVVQVGSGFRIGRAVTIAEGTRQ